MRTDGEGRAPGASDRDDELASIDIAIAVLDHLGAALGRGRLQTAVLVFEDGPVAMGHHVRVAQNVAAIGGGGDLPGALLAQIHRLAREDVGDG